MKKLFNSPENLNNQFVYFNYQIPGMTFGNTGSPIHFFMFMKKRTIVFIDGNNWYHNSKKMISNHKDIDFSKIIELVANKFDLEIKEIRYYNSIPDIEDGKEVYYNHIKFLSDLKKKVFLIFTRKLQKIDEEKREKGIDVKISVDMMNKCLIEDKCNCCLLFSGDADFIPVMEIIKKAKKEVITCCTIIGYARELLQGKFRYFILRKKDLLENLK